MIVTPDSESPREGFLAGILARWEPWDCRNNFFLPIIGKMVKWLGRQTLRIVSGFGDFALFTGAAFRSAVQSEKGSRKKGSAIYY